MQSLRFPGETREKFRLRAERASRVARILVDACLANVWVQDLIADPELPFYTEESIRRNPVVRIDYDEAFAIAGIGEGLALTKRKNWGDGPRILPLDPEDYVDHMYIGYVYKESSRYNRRVLQRRRMKELLGSYRSLVLRAMCHHHSQGIFLRMLTPHEAAVIERVFGIDPKTFWRAARGKVVLDLPPRRVQQRLFEI